MSKEFKENWESLGTYWNTKKGLAFFFFLFLSSYYGFLSDFIKDNLFENKLIRVWILPLFFLIIIYLIWAFLSHRLNLYKKRKITTGLFFKCNNFDSEIKIKEIIQDLINDLEDEFIDIKFKLFPINYIANKKELDDFVVKKNHIIDNAFFAVIYNGNCLKDSQTVSKIEIQNILFSAQIDNIDQSDFRNKINLSEDLSLSDIGKNWEYFESRSFADKLKIKHNLKDSLLFFNGLYSISIKEYTLALNIFKSLKYSEEISGAVYSNIRKQRLNEILSNLFTFNAIEDYLVKKDLNSAYNLLKECEVIFQNNHQFAFSNFITLSRIYFEKGNIEMARKYTNNALKLNKDSAAIFCNLGFFSILDNNTEGVYLNYRELAHVYKFKGTLNFLEIIHFIDLHKKNYPASLHLFNFAIATLNFLYADKDLGRKQLIEVQKVFNDNIIYSKLYNLIDFFLTKGSIKSPYFQRDKKKKKLKRR